MSEPAHDVLVGLHVTDEASYDRYRAAMKPILHRVGGRFVADLRVSGVLTKDVTRTDAEGSIDPRVNRVFLLRFPDAATKDAFFSDPGYVEARRAHFEGAVGVVNLISESG